MAKKFIPAYLLTFVNVLGFSILMPILPFVVDTYGAPKWVFGLLLTLYSAFQFIGAPMLGGMSDSMGRKRILLISQGGTLLSWIIFAVALSLPEFPIFGVALPLIIIAISRAFDGITGGNVSVTNAYISDITTREEKSYIFGYLGGIAGIGMIIGPGLGGLAGSTSLGYLGTILVAMAVSVVALLTIFLWLKESHPPENRVPRERMSVLKLLNIPGRVKKANPSEVIKSIFAIKMLFSSMMAFYIGTISLFLIDLFEFNTQELGIFLFVVGVFLSFNQAVLSKIFVKRFGEFRTLLIGLSFCTVGVLAITMTSNLYLFIAFYYIMNLGLSLCFPTFNALISMHANPKKQGEIMGISEAINSFAMALFPVVSAFLYDLFGFGLYFFISALPATGLLLAILSLRKVGAKAFD
ncbi:MAG: MFS transporter [bacterium]|nr:MFS transporter [bacterium]